MTPPSPAVRVGGEPTRAAVPTCSWAACHNPATAVADGWPMCGPHLREHHTLEMEALLADGDLDGLIRKLHRQGATDRQMAAATGIEWWQVRYRRRAMGLLSARPAADCGTRAGAARGKRQVTDVQRDTRRARDARKRAA